MVGRRGARRRVAGAVLVLVAIGAVAGCKPGTRDRGFGDRGTVVLAGAPAGDDVSAAPAADGGLVVVRGAEGEQEGELVRLAVDGSVVDGWGGALPVPCGERDEVDRHGDGYLLACTSTGADGSRATDIVRVGADGEPDAGFGTGGVTRLAGEVEGAAAVPLPGGGILALGGRSPEAATAPVLVTTVLDAHGQVVSTTEEEVAIPSWPPDQGLGVDVTVTAEPTTTGAVAAVHPGIVLFTADWIRPADPFLLVFDGAGAPVRRLEGPAYPDGTGDSTIVSLAELPGGHIAALEERWVIVEGPRPTADYSYPVHVYAPDGTEVASFEPARPPAGADPEERLLYPTTLLATAGGRHLLVGGSYAPAPFETHGAVLRYDTATWAVDPAFGAGGLAALGSRDVVHDLDPRGDDPGRVDATARRIPTDTDPATPAVVTRLWNPPLEPAPSPSPSPSPSLSEGGDGGDGGEGAEGGEGEPAG